VHEFGVEYSTSVWDMTSAKEIITLSPRGLKYHLPAIFIENVGLLVLILLVKSISQPA